MNITYWSDYACPYCYIGETHLKQALDALGIDEATIAMKSFELDPNASREDTGTTVDRFSRKYGLTREEGLSRVQSISDMAKEAGIGFDYADTRYTNTFDAHRLTKYAESIDKKLADKLAERLYRAYFVEKKRLADFDTLLECAIDVGLDEDGIKEVLFSDRFGSEVRADETLAHQMNINAVPFFIVDGKVGIPGALPVETFKEILEDVASGAL